MGGLRISELAERVGVATSTVRYYERIGLVPAPARTPAGYRTYDGDAESRLLFITRAKRLGLSLDETAELLAVWDGSHCTETQEHLARLLVTKRDAIAVQVEELERFADQLAAVQERLMSPRGRDGCTPDLDCCAPDVSSVEVTLVRAAPELDSPSLPVACTLTLGERPARIAEFASLARHLDGWTRDGTALRLRFSRCPTVEAQVRELSAEEERCCGFLTFDVERRDEWVVWTITAPDRETAMTLDEFLPLVSETHRDVL